MKQTFFLFCLTLIVMTETEAQKFSGHFAGSQSGIQSTAELTVTGKQLGGSVSMNGNKATVTGTINDSISTGTVYDVVTGKTYSYYSILKGNELKFSITFPELNDQAIQLQMQRITAAAANEKTVNDPSKKKDPRLVGTWRYTDIITSGSGGNFSSFSTDYFMEFKADGTLLTWRGSSGGSVGDQTISTTNGNSATEKGQWYTEGKTLFLVDPATGQKASTLFYAEASRIMLHNGGDNKKVWERIR
ncbi:MAG TPA: hypothetical protein VHM26_15790 [Chitinophagaceae bacterium]|jgi:hypothetical protein|nr:hypothetical protein [Chitinophagaceae bacterium]